MAGLYVHIPFCKSKCSYCDFFSVASLVSKDKLVGAMVKEIELQKNYLERESLKTIYFGGGTPSVLSIKDIDSILTTINKYHVLENHVEITLEANPDDLKMDYLQNLRKLGINRLSIGVQSFIDRDLELMKRRHNANDALLVIKNAQKCNFDNISVDLIYGLPGLTINDWIYNLDSLLDLNVQHISAYNLTIEQNTIFNKWLKQGKINLPSDAESIKQFEILIEKTNDKKFVHYEISNFALDGFFSEHNSNYWNNEKYLGIGPSAHSYNLSSRQWNISSLPEYISVIIQGNVPCEQEILTINDKYNDYILTSLRTLWGISLRKVENDFGKLYFDFLLKSAETFVKSNHLIKNNEKICLTIKGIFIADLIIREMLKV